MVVNVDRGERIKIKNLDFNGNDKFGNFILATKLKNTKKRFPLRFWKKSKYIADDFEEDKQNLIDFYKEKGYRDARILKDTLILNSDNTLSVKLDIEEGRYYFGDIRFIGNSAYTDYQLQQILGIK